MKWVQTELIFVLLMASLRSTTFFQCFLLCIVLFLIKHHFGTYLLKIISLFKLRCSVFLFKHLTPLLILFNIRGNLWTIGFLPNYSIYLFTQSTKMFLMSWRIWQFLLIYILCLLLYIKIKACWFALILLFVLLWLQLLNFELFNN